MSALAVAALALAVALAAVLLAALVMLDKLSHALRDQLKALVGDATTRAAYGGFWGAPGRCAPHTRAAARTDPWRAEPNLSTTCPAEERT